MVENLYEQRAPLGREGKIVMVTGTFSTSKNIAITFVITSQ